MKNENIHAYSWSAQQRKARRDRMFECAAVLACVAGVIGMVTLFVYMLSA